MEQFEQESNQELAEIQARDKDWKKRVLGEIAGVLATFIGAAGAGVGLYELMKDHQFVAHAAQIFSGISGWAGGIIAVKYAGGSREYQKEEPQ